MSMFTKKKNATDELESPNVQPAKPILATRHSIESRKHSKRKVTFFDFKGMLAPVFTCFSEEDGNVLETNQIEKYAAYLKKEHVAGVVVNSITGEGPSLGVAERKTNVEMWWQAAIKHDLICVVQVGGASIADVIELAKHADSLGVHAVLCLPDLFYKPATIKRLVDYCRLVSKHCISRPFLYYHIPRFTGVYFDMALFCDEAQKVIPYFYGLQYSSPDLEMGYRCLREDRVVLLGIDVLMASGLLLGFESVQMACLNIRPDLGRDILNAMQENNLLVAREKQLLLNNLIKKEFANSVASDLFVTTMKNWFNHTNKAGISAGPARQLYWVET